MPPGGRRGGKVPVHLPFVELSRNVASSRWRTSWPRPRQLQQLPDLRLSDLFPSVSKTGLGTTSTSQSEKDGSKSKSKPFSFSLQHQRDYPWSTQSLPEGREVSRRSYEKPKGTSGLPVDPISRLVWDDKVAPPFGNVNDKHNDLDGDLEDNLDNNKVPSNILKKANNAFKIPPIDKPQTSLNPLRNPKGPKKFPFQLLKYAKMAAARRRPKLDDNAQSGGSKDKFRDSGYNSPMDFKGGKTTGLPDIKDPEKAKSLRPANISHYHANCYDSDDDLDSSWTLPRIETVLRSEGVEPGSISHQIEKIRTRKSRHQRSISLRNSRSEGKIPKGPKLPQLSRNLEGVLDYDNDRRLRLKQIQSKRKLAEEVETEGEMMPRLMEDPDSSKAKEAIDQYFRDIENIRWMSQQQIERGLVQLNIPIPRVVLVSSQIPNASGLLQIVKDGAVLPILYDYVDETFEGILRGIRLRIDEYQQGYNMKSLLIYCQGGPGYIYFLKKKVFTRPKLQGTKHPDIAKFVSDLGALVSKVDRSEAYVHLLGGKGQEKDQESVSAQFMEALEAAVSPNVVHFETVDDENDRGKNVIQLYFDFVKYQQWKADQIQKE